LQELREMDEEEANFNNYENAITFMDRQVKKASMKLSEKDVEVSALLEELKLLQQDSQKEVGYIRDKAKQEIKGLYDKMFKLEDEVDGLQLQIKNRERFFKRREKEFEDARENQQIEVENLQKIIE
jgi:peptidoglycan hydrolase CwlO-like protein